MKNFNLKEILNQKEVKKGKMEMLNNRLRQSNTKQNQIYTFKTITCKLMKERIQMPFI